MKWNGFLTAGLVIHGILSLTLFVISVEPYHSLGLFLCIVTAAQISGAIMILQGQILAGLKLIKWTSVIFVPIGMIAMLGAQKIIDVKIREDFESRR